MPGKGNLLGASVVLTGICLIFAGEIGMEGTLTITNGDWITLGGAIFFNVVYHTNGQSKYPNTNSNIRF